MSTRSVTCYFEYARKKFFVHLDDKLRFPEVRRVLLKSFEDYFRRIKFIMRKDEKIIFEKNYKELIDSDYIYPGDFIIAKIVQRAKGVSQQPTEITLFNEAMTQSKHLSHRIDFTRFPAETHTYDKRWECVISVTYRGVTEYFSAFGKSQQDSKLAAIHEVKHKFNLCESVSKLPSSLQPKPHMSEDEMIELLYKISEYVPLRSKRGQTKYVRNPSTPLQSSPIKKLKSEPIGCLKYESEDDESEDDDDIVVILNPIDPMIELEKKMKTLVM